MTFLMIYLLSTHPRVGHHRLNHTLELEPFQGHHHTQVLPGRAKQGTGAFIPKHGPYQVHYHGKRNNNNPFRVSNWSGSQNRLVGGPGREGRGTGVFHPRLGRDGAIPSTTNICQKKKNKRQDDALVTSAPSISLRGSEDRQVVEMDQRMNKVGIGGDANDRSDNLLLELGLPKHWTY